MQTLARNALVLFLAITVGIAVSLLIVWQRSTISMEQVFDWGPHTNPYSLVVSMGLLFS